MSSQRKIAEAVVAKMKGKEGRMDERGTEPEVHGEVFRGTSEDKKSRLTVIQHLGLNYLALLPRSSSMHEAEP